MKKGRCFFLRVGNVWLWGVVVFLGFFLVSARAEEADEGAEPPDFFDRYPPTYIYKFSPGRPFFDFDFSDLENKRWHCRDLRGKPVIILTAHRSLRHDILKWALFLKDGFESAGKIHLLWVVNLSKYPWETNRTGAQEEWARFNPPIPLILDWHAQVGRGLKITYEIPNIIGIDSFGNLAFHEMLPCSEKNAEYMAERIRRLVDIGFRMP